MTDTDSDNKFQGFLYLATTFIFIRLKAQTSLTFTQIKTS